ncbi:MAG: hypothetical protein LC118_21490 [Dehalococcoidia bacterium]|nr:hypothetical protein [Dehalococcoidia bacterium]
MSSSAKPGRVIRSARHEAEDVFVFGQSTPYVPADSVLATATAVIEAGQREGEAVIAAAHDEAARVVAEAQAMAAEVREAAYSDGYQAGLQQAASEINGFVEIARRAANEGKQLRDDIAGQAAAVVARAVTLAVRRIVSEYYESDPERTGSLVAETLRAAAGQEILAIRVHSGLVDAISASLADVTTYIRPDDAVEIGGCIIDLRNGTIDATLDARLSLMDLALREAGGEASR